MGVDDLSQVTMRDQMPQRICALCVDKINDIYEYREMCSATNKQTRKLLGLPDVVVKLPKSSKKREVCIGQRIDYIT